MGKIGFIGLGIMGKPMAKNLLKAGKSLVVFDVLPAADGHETLDRGALGLFYEKLNGISLKK